jgi:hypothetical protein
MLKKPAATIRARCPSGKFRFNSRQYEGERSLTAISQNFFVVSFEVTPFSQSTMEKKESLAERVMPGKGLCRCRSRRQSSDRGYRQTMLLPENGRSRLTRR